MKPTEPHHLKKHSPDSAALLDSSPRSNVLRFTADNVDQALTWAGKRPKEVFQVFLLWTHSVPIWDQQHPSPPSTMWMANSFPLLSHRMMEPNQTPPSDRQSYVLLGLLIPVRETQRKLKWQTVPNRMRPPHALLLIIYWILQHIWSTETFVTIKPETDGRICSQTHHSRWPNHGKGDVTKGDSFKVESLLLL